VVCMFIFFFQAEDGIRDRNVTGVQTCALPISDGTPKNKANETTPNIAVKIKLICQLNTSTILPLITGPNKAPIVINAAKVPIARSEERRVGKECRSRRSLES